MLKFFASLSVIVVLAIIIISLFYLSDSRVISGVNSFEECISLGFPILESYPRQCKTPDGKTFVEEIEEVIEDKSDLIVVDYSSFDIEALESPLTVKGKARGVWFFEADFSVKLLDGERNLLTQGIAQAEGDWMTEDFVNFSATLNFEEPQTSSGTLILEKDNPSGLPEHEDSLEIPIKFKLTETAKACQVTGCSGQICSDEEVTTTCEFLPQYQCFSLAKCERQTDGTCGWTKTEEFESCLSDL